jgi:integrase/recombinase XerD
MIDSVFLVESIREKHRKAPLLVEREKYIEYLFEIGTRRERVRNVATMLLHIVRLLELNSPRLVAVDEILQGSKRWVDDPGSYRFRRAGEASGHTFQQVATNWLRYQGSLIMAPKREPCFHDLLSRFLDEMCTQRGLSLETIRSYRSRVSAFLNWLHPRCMSSQVCGSEILRNSLKRSERMAGCVPR